MESMKRFAATVLSVIASLVVLNLGLKAQQPGDVDDPAPAAQLPAAALPARPPSSLPAPSPISTAPVADEGSCCPHTCKICVSEPKHNTKKVFACKCEEYCLPRCSFL